MWSYSSDINKPFDMCGLWPMLEITFNAGLSVELVIIFDFKTDINKWDDEQG